VGVAPSGIDHGSGTLGRMALVLDSLTIRGFRSLERLDVERLGRANLLVGRNGSGKSSVLEALKLYATAGAASAFYEILRARDEIAAWRDSRSRPDVGQVFFSVRQLFNGRVETGSPASIVVGPIKDERDRLLISLTVDGGHPQIKTERDGALSFLHMLQVGDGVDGIEETLLPHQYVSPNGLGLSAMASLWDAVTLTDLEEEVLRAVRIISPALERVSFVVNASHERVAMAKLRNEPRPVPVKSLGDGVTRLLGIALALVSARHGFLLIDEAENGIHFSAQADLWRLIFATAARLNVQVFATTHSWDCIQAFQEAAVNDSHEEAALIRLEARDGVTVPTIISEHDLSIVTREQIEVR
jgi:ABC-type Mn2+/Zn2+ transport system ATPase subunit